MNSILPEIPHDNIYKFIAFSGLLLTLFLIVYPANLREEVLTQVAENEYKSQIDSLKMKAWIKEIGELKNVVSKIEKPQPNTFVMTQSVAAKLDCLVVRVNKQSNEVAMANLESKRRQKLFEILFEKLKDISKFQFVGSIIGALMFFGGLAAWYLQIQRYVDKKLQKEATK